MSSLFYIIGKSSTGKDTIYKELCQKKELNLRPLVMYTTRPIRDMEKDGREYYFVDDVTLKQLEQTGKVIEKRAYHTIYGIWTYFTVDDQHLDLESQDYLAIGTLESYEKIRDYYGDQKVVPLYIEVEDGLRLERALDRERKQQPPKYEEMCRRFLADSDDFSEKNLQRAEIQKRFINADMNECLDELLQEIRRIIG